MERGGQTETESLSLIIWLQMECFVEVELAIGS